MGEDRDLGEDRLWQNQGVIRVLHAGADLVDLGDLCEIKRRFKVKIDLGEFTGLWRWIEGLRKIVMSLEENLVARSEGEGGTIGEPQRRLTKPSL